jgi:hypothetical protein
MVDDPLCDGEQKHEQRIVVRHRVKQCLLADLADANPEGTGRSGFMRSVLALEGLNHSTKAMYRS